MDIKSMCKSRRIRKIDVETPLLVPSFSSVASEILVKEVHEKLTDHVPMASLVSAYDLYYNSIDKEQIWVSEVVFVDSGKHEVDFLKRTRSKDLRAWSPSKYLEVISSLNPLTNVVLVNFDEKGPLKEQITKATALFEKFPDYATCFLCKPTSERMNVVDLGGLVKNITLIESFDILGLTEKELGTSLLKRCQNLLKIRVALNTKNLTTPIHIFGCLDPLSVISYFLSGADIFDGTLWLKFSFHENIAIYVNNHPFLKGSWSESDSSVKASAYVLNLNELTHLMYHMRRFTQEYTFDVFRIKEEILSEVKDLTSTAGLKY